MEDCYRSAPGSRHPCNMCNTGNEAVNKQTGGSLEQPSMEYGARRKECVGRNLQEVQIENLIWTLRSELTQLIKADDSLLLQLKSIDNSISGLKRVLQNQRGVPKCDCRFFIDSSSDEKSAQGDKQESNDQAISKTAEVDSTDGVKEVQTTSDDSEQTSINETQTQAPVSRVISWLSDSDFEAAACDEHSEHLSHDVTTWKLKTRTCDNITGSDNLEHSEVSSSVPGRLSVLEYRSLENVECGIRDHRFVETLFDIDHYKKMWRSENSLTSDAPFSWSRSSPAWRSFSMLDKLDNYLLNHVNSRLKLQPRPRLHRQGSFGDSFGDAFDFSFGDSPSKVFLSDADCQRNERTDRTEQTRVIPITIERETGATSNVNRTVNVPIFVEKRDGSVSEQLKSDSGFDDSFEDLDNDRLGRRNYNVSVRHITPEYRHSGIDDKPSGYMRPKTPDNIRTDAFTDASLGYMRTRTPDYVRTDTVNNAAVGYKHTKTPENIPVGTFNDKPIDITERLSAFRDLTGKGGTGGIKINIAQVPDDTGSHNTKRIAIPIDHTSTIRHCDLVKEPDNTTAPKLEENTGLNDDSATKPQDLLEAAGGQAETEATENDKEGIAIPIRDDAHFITFQDGMVQCRIMSPNLERQISEQNEEGGGDFEFLTIEDGKVVFRSRDKVVEIDDESFHIDDLYHELEELERLQKTKHYSDIEQADSLNDTSESHECAEDTKQSLHSDSNADTTDSESYCTAVTDFSENKTDVDEKEANAIETDETKYDIEGNNITDDVDSADIENSTEAEESTVKERDTVAADEMNSTLNDDDNVTKNTINEVDKTEVHENVENTGTHDLDNTRENAEDESDDTVYEDKISALKNRLAECLELDNKKSDQVKKNDDDDLLDDEDDDYEDYEDDDGFKFGRIGCRVMEPITNYITPLETLREVSEEREVETPDSQNHQTEESGKVDAPLENEPTQKYIVENESGDEITESETVSNGPLIVELEEVSVEHGEDVQNINEAETTSGAMCEVVCETNNVQQSVETTEQPEANLDASLEIIRYEQNIYSDCEVTDDDGDKSNRQ